MNEIVIPASIDENDAYALLSRAVNELTGAGSSSVPIETARDLLAGILYHISLGAGQPDAFRAYEAGVSVTTEKTRRAKKRYDYLISQARDYSNLTLHDTLIGLKAFFERYNPRLYPLETPADIDYQLSCPLPERLKGVDYALEYIRRLSIEERFTLRYKESDVKKLLTKYSPECDQLAINVFDIVFANAVGRAILGLSREKLLLSREEREDLINLLYARSGEFIAGQVKKGIDFLSKELNMQNADSAWYFSLSGDSLCKRLRESLAYAPDGEACELFLTE